MTSRLLDPLSTGSTGNKSIIPQPEWIERFVCRVSGLPFSAVLRLHDVTLLGLLDEFVDAEKLVARDRDSLSAALHSAIGSTREKAARNLLIEVRRRLYNAVRLTPRMIDGVASLLPIELAGRIVEADEMIAECASRVDQIRTRFPQVLATTRSHLQAELGDPDLQKGIAMSSPSLFRNLPRFLAASGAAIGSRNEQIERGLLRYFTRMSTKATPFATFCAVIEGRLSGDSPPNGAPVTLHGDPRCKTTIVRLNKRIFARLWEHLQHVPAVRERLKVERNPTLRVEENRLVYLAAVGTQEVFQRAARTDALEVVLHLTHSGSAPSYRELIDRLSSDPRCEATEEEAVAFSDRLIEIGLLRLRGVVAEQEADWITPMVAFLDGAADDSGRKVRELLLDLHNHVTDFKAASPSQRASVLNAIHTRLTSGFADLGLSPWSASEHPVYEDATANAQLEIPLTQEMEVVLSRAAEWVRLTLPLAGPRNEMATMRHYFDSTYGNECAGVPLLQFYENYYRDHFKEYLLQQQQPSRPAPKIANTRAIGNPFGLESVILFNKTVARLTDLIRTEWRRTPHVEEISLSLSSLEKAMASISGTDYVSGRSVSVFSQIFLDASSNSRIIIRGGAHLAGYGKYFSRFLYLLPDSCQQLVRESNSRISGDILAEISGDASFNANLHPPLLAHEISYPTGQQTDAANQLRSSELTVARDPANPHALVLRRDANENQVVWPIDVGFLNPLMRPPLYQLLIRFSPVFGFTYPLPIFPNGDAASGIQYRPRISYEKAVVISRRSWTIPKELFPVVQPGESEADYFIRVNRWHRAEGIPSKVYARTRALPTPPPTVVDVDGNQSTTVDGVVTTVESDIATLEDPTVSAREDGLEALGPGDDGIDTNSAHVNTDGSEEASGSNAAKKKQLQHQSRDYHKPQFVDFASPLLVRLFGRLHGSLPQFVVILEECFPSPDDLPVAQGLPYATELILQLAFPAVPADSERVDA